MSEHPVTNLTPLLSLDELHDVIGGLTQDGVGQFTTRDVTLDGVQYTTPIGSLGQDKLTNDLDVELDMVLLQDTVDTLEELTRQFLGFLGVTEVEVKHSTTTVDGVDDVVRVVTGKDEPTVVLELLNQGTECFLGVLCQVVSLIQDTTFLEPINEEVDANCRYSITDITNTTVERKPLTNRRSTSSSLHIARATEVLPTPAGPKD